MQKFVWLFIANMACLSMAVPVLAQQSATVPLPSSGLSEQQEVPPAPGQPLIEWRRPPLLDYTIAPDKVDDLTSCGEDDFFYVNDTSQTCAPLLSMNKLFIQLDFATSEARSRLRKNRPDAADYRKKALNFADQIIAEHGEPKWPLQVYLLSKTYQRRASIYEAWSEWDTAITEQDKRIALLSDSKFKPRDILFAQSYQQKGDYLIAKGDRVAARSNYEESFAVNKWNAFEPFSQLQQHTEAMVTDAIFARDYDSALDWIERYLKIYKDQAALENRSSAFGGEILLNKLVAMRIYIHAAEGQEAEMTDATYLYETLYRGRNMRCFKYELFPQVIAPFHTKISIKNWLIKIGCDERIFKAMDDVPVAGVTGYQGKLLLPPHQD